MCIWVKASSTASASRQRRTLWRAFYIFISCLQLVRLSVPIILRIGSEISSYQGNMQGGCRLVRAGIKALSYSPRLNDPSPSPQPISPCPRPLHYLACQCDLSVQLSRLTRKATAFSVFQLMFPAEFHQSSDARDLTFHASERVRFQMPTSFRLVSEEDQRLRSALYAMAVSGQELHRT